jgi:hypothetical protein
MKPLINLLIRNKHRPSMFRRCIRSIGYSGYGNLRLIIGCDSAESIRDVITLFDKSPFSPLVVPLRPDKSHSHYWNLYCNDLKSRVDAGWFLFLDNDDWIAPGALGKLAEVLAVTDPGTGIICQFERNGKPKPNNALISAGSIQEGRIGGGCIVLHHSQKDVANWDGNKAADFRFIRDVSEKIPLKFVHLLVQIAGNNGLHGK